MNFESNTYFARAKYLILLANVVFHWIKRCIQVRKRYISNAKCIANQGVYDNIQVNISNATPFVSMRVGLITQCRVVIRAVWPIYQLFTLMFVSC